jgi:N-acyl-L-homoserine lactone synthetase
MYSIRVQGQQRYCLRQLHRSDYQRQRDYQRLRAKIFVEQFGWQIPVDSIGCERDRYDGLNEDRVQISCVYGQGAWRSSEWLLGGVRTFILGSWNESMTMNEFYATGMIPDTVVQMLEEKYNPLHILEITRLCLQRGHLYKPWESIGYKTSPFHLGVARDLVYASVFALAEQTQRHLALGITDRYYLKVMRKSHFIFDELYTSAYTGASGYSLFMIDLPATIDAMRYAGMHERVKRMLILQPQNSLAKPA